MKYVRIVFILILLVSNYFAYSQQQDSVMTETATWSNGVKKYYYLFSKGIYDYDFTYWHPNGSLHIKGHYYNNDIYIYNSWDKEGNTLVVDGVGYHIDYYENGQIKRKGFIKNKMIDSLWVEYYPNGQMKSKGSYVKSISHSRENGIWTYWYDNGQIESSGLFEDGIKKGVWTYYYRNGEKRAKIEGSEFMNRGKYIETFDTSGNPLIRIGKGIYLNYYENNALKEKINIVDSIKDTAYYYFPNGKLRAIVKYYNDRKGLLIYDDYLVISCWDTAGNQILKNTTGWYIEYDNEWDYKFKYYYTNGVRDSLNYSYYKNGKVQQIDKYHDSIWVYRTIYYNNSNKYLEFNCYGLGIFGNTKRLKYHFNGKLKSEEEFEFVKNYYSNGQIESIGYFLQDSVVIEEKYNKQAFLVNTWEGSFGISYGSYGTPNNLYREKWYSDGTLKNRVVFDTITNSLLYSQYYKNNTLIIEGNVKYDRWKNEDNSDYFYHGYLKTGIWKYYTSDGKLSETIDYDKKLIKERKLE